MSWYKNTHFGDDLAKKIAQDIDSKKSFFGSSESFQDGVPNQRGSASQLFDVKRYSMDSYNMNIGISQTKNKIYVTFRVTHGSLGSVTFVETWYYHLDQFEMAKDTYIKLNKSFQLLTTEFVENEKPTSMFWAYAKDICKRTDVDHQFRTGLPQVNYSKKYDMEPDWKFNIYGNRYPEHKEYSFADDKDIEYYKFNEHNGRQQ